MELSEQLVGTINEHALPLPSHRGGPHAAMNVSHPSHAGEGSGLPEHAALVQVAVVHRVGGLSHAELPPLLPPSPSTQRPAPLAAAALRGGSELSHEQPPVLAHWSSVQKQQHPPSGVH